MKVRLAQGLRRRRATETANVSEHKASAPESLIQPKSITASRLPIVARLPS